MAKDKKKKSTVVKGGMPGIKRQVRKSMFYSPEQYARGVTEALKSVKSTFGGTAPKKKKIKPLSSHTSTKTKAGRPKAKKKMNRRVKRKAKVVRGSKSRL